MGGSAGPGNPIAAAEFNSAVDPGAINVVTAPGVPMQWVELNACQQGPDAGPHAQRA